MPKPSKPTNAPEPEDSTEDSDAPGRSSFTASLLIQGEHRFYTLSMPSGVLAETCMVLARREEPIYGFQRILDEKRAKDIANYIDSGQGTIPSSIVLSAQPEANLKYRRTNRTLSFNRHPKAFLILDGQHRVFGFRLAVSSIRVPVVIYNGLTRTEEARLFMDINTKQRPVPNELILDIKRLADTENDSEALFHEVFDLFANKPESPLLGLMSSAERKKGKISRVSFNNALNSVYDSISGSDPEEVYRVLAAYVQCCVAGLRRHKLESLITNPIVFKALMLMFPMVAARVSDRYDDNYTVANFNEVVSPWFLRIKRSELVRPGRSASVMFEILKKSFHAGFSLRKGVFS